MASSTEIEDFVESFEKEFSLVSFVSSSDNNGYEVARTWVVDSGSTQHMTGTWDVFLNISEIGPGQYVNEAYEVRGVGRVRFQLEFGELLEVDGVLFVPGLRVNLLSVSTLEDVRYATLFKRGYPSSIQ
jgi:hypothetical protein